MDKRAGQCLVFFVLAIFVKKIKEEYKNQLKVFFIKI